MSSAYLLVSHGSRDPRPEVAMQQLAKLCQRQSAGRINLKIPESKALVEVGDWAQTESNISWRTLKSSNAGLVVSQKEKSLVGTACLELSPEPLHEQIRQFGDHAMACGYNRVQVLPLFLLPGMHVMEDIPAEVAIAQQALEQVKIDLRPHLGTHPGLSHLLATSMAAIEADAWILLAHGSRRPGSKQTVEAIATQLNTVSAYWAISPKLATQVKALVDTGYQQIGILPYFLFAGGITDAIASTVELLEVQFPSVNLALAEPIGASVELADLIWDLIEK
ncbi:MAG: sirohydrochlorin chelatase [Gloeocapsa sp. UFS-A4-WI-NPMV-4B04]|jgi:sirohydrochlorin ferrochelatase|nr:sirohydrochlorin chelatase [Gloeocapsa sp. UFS-A4-WI-NPMV-4B04]